MVNLSWTTDKGRRLALLLYPDVDITQENLELCSKICMCVVSLVNLNIERCNGDRRKEFKDYDAWEYWFETSWSATSGKIVEHVRALKTRLKKDAGKVGVLLGTEPAVGCVIITVPSGRSNDVEGVGIVVPIQ